jgi:DNA-binding SARP family transcriptional activator
VSRDALADSIWCGDPPAGYAATLQTYVFHLRAALEPDRPRRTPARVLVSEPNAYRLVVADELIDATLFERSVSNAAYLLGEGRAPESRAAVDAALALWRGAPLVDVVGLPFLDPFIMRLEELRLNAVEIGMDADLRTGRHDRVLVESAALVAAHPLRERVHQQRMLALYRSGRQADALATYLDLRRALVTELGVEPSRELRDLQHRILTQDISLDIQRELAAAAASGRPERRQREVAAAAVLAAGSVTAATVLHHRHRLLPSRSARTHRSQ